MTLEEFRKNRRERLQHLKEGIMDNMPYPDGKTAHIEYGPTEGMAILDSEERAKKVKDSFKDKDKEVEEFIKDQDKATGAKTEDKSENRSVSKLHLDESLFEAVNFDKEKKNDRILCEIDDESLEEAAGDAQVIQTKDGDIESALEQIPDSFWSIN